MQASSHSTVSVSLLHSYPNESDFVPLAEHQGSTPETYFGGKPVLHCSFADASILTTSREIHANHELSQLLGTPSSSSSSSSISPEQKITIEHISGLVTSESLLLWRTKGASAPATLAIPYNAISLHAIQTAPLDGTAEESNGDGAKRRTVYLQLEPMAFTRNEDDESAIDQDDTWETIELSLVPSSSSSSATISGMATNGDTRTAEGHGANASAMEIFEALSRCADLHPDLGALDPADEDEWNGEGGAGQGLLSGGGWITSENAHEFEDGAERGDIAVNVDVEVYEEEEDVPPASARTNSIGEGLGPLGAGAGITRPRQAEQEGEDGDEEAKWQRTS